MAGCLPGDRLAQIAALDQALARTAKELKQAKQKKRDAGRSSGSAWKLSTAVLRPVLIIYGLPRTLPSRQ